jgi:hypothetical protein
MVCSYGPEICSFSYVLKFELPVKMGPVQSSATAIYLPYKSTLRSQINGSHESVDREEKGMQRGLLSKT